MIILGAEHNAAELQLAAIRAMIHAVGQAQASHLGLAHSAFATAESDAVSLVVQTNRRVLGVALDIAQSARAPHSVSWVFRRLHDLASAPAEVRVSTQLQVSSIMMSFGATQPQYESYLLPGRGYFRLPGPVRAVAVRGAEVHPQTHAQRTHLDIGRTLVHELVVHAWREVLLVGAGLRNAPPAVSSLHQARQHIPSSTTAHNLADAESDLIDYYYDLARGHTVAFGEHGHPDFARIIGVLGGVMGSRIPSLEPYRRNAPAYAVEQAQFLERARQFRQQMDRMMQLESSVSGQ